MKKRLVTLLLALAVATSATACGNKASANYYYGCVDTTCETATGDYSYAPSPSKNYSNLAPEACTEAVAGDYSSEECLDPFLGYEPEETYDVLKESSFKSVSLSPLSTFAADVDTACYANVRRLIKRNGYMVGGFSNVAVRPEEMINYFKYDYKAPEGNNRFNVNSTISDCPWNEETKLMVLGINAMKLNEDKTPDSNIVFLIDVSGSMDDEDKLPLLKDSMKLLVESLSKNDKVSIVTYANGTSVVLDGVSCDKKKTINKAFDKLMAGGGTNGESGIELAYEIAKKNYIEGGNNRVIIATDGDFNIGKHHGNELEDLISEKKETGVFLSVLGFGSGNYNDITGETLADKGNGNYSYIDCLDEAKRVLVDEFGSTIYTVAKDTKFQVEFNPAMISEYRLIGYENRALNDEDFTDDTKDGGEVGAGHQVTVIYEIKLVDSEGGTNLKYQDKNINKKGLSKDEWCTVSIAYKDPNKEKSEYLEFPIGEGNYTNKPDDNFVLASSVAEFAMALKESDFLEDVTPEDAVRQAMERVQALDSEDERVRELAVLMKMSLESTDIYYLY